MKQKLFSDVIQYHQKMTTTAITPNSNSPCCSCLNKTFGMSQTAIHPPPPINQYWESLCNNSDNLSQVCQLWTKYVSNSFRPDDGNVIIVIVCLPWWDSFIWSITCIMGTKNLSSVLKWDYFLPGSDWTWSIWAYGKIISSFDG